MPYNSRNKIILIFICLLFFESRHIKAQSAAICQGDSAVLQMNCNYLGTLQWQQSSDQVNWLNIIGATLDSIKVKPSNTTYYRAAIAGGTCNLIFSDTAVITVNLIPSPPSISVVDTCGSSRLIAIGFTGILLWSTGQTVNPITVNSAGTYTLTQTVNGCISSTGSGSAAPLVVPIAPTVGTNTPTQAQIVWNWNIVPGAMGYKYNNVNNYNTATDNLGNLSYTQTGLTCNTPYTLYIWAYNGCGNSPVTILTLITSACCSMPDAPLAGTNTPSSTQIIWNWNSVSGATGYQWNTSNTYPGIGINVVSSPTYTQTGLTCNTAYTLYVWAYNSCGNSLVTVLTQTTAACCVIPPPPVVYNCGGNLTASGFTGTLLWSTGQTVNPITVTGTGTYTVTQTVNGCTSINSNSISITASSTSQYASSVIAYSTQWTPTTWTATETLGAPNTCSCGDIPTAWASTTTDGQREFLILGFTTPQVVSKIIIYETFNPGAVDTVYLRNSSTQIWNTVWSGTAAPASPCPRAFEINISTTGYTVDAIRIAINSPVVPSWNEIDAVEIQ